MNRQEFLSALRDALSGLPENDIEERVAFYNEMIEDRMEEGLGEEEAVAGIGTVDEVRTQIITEMPLAKLVKEKVKPKRSLRAWEIVLIIVGFPLWFPLAVAAFAVILSLYLVLWVLVLSLWVIEAALLAGALFGLVMAFVHFFLRKPFHALVYLGAGLLLAGLAILLFFACLKATKGAVKLAKKAGVALKSKLAGKEITK